MVEQPPQLEHEIGTIEHLLTLDLRVRVSIARLDQPDAITGVLGRRPAPRASARNWDDAAGRLAQHQAAFNIAEGIGPHPRWDRENAYQHGHQALAATTAPTRLAPTRRIAIEPRGIEL